MKNLEVAQIIANQIETSTQEEIEAMMKITCLTHGIEMSLLMPVVGNIYAKN